MTERQTEDSGEKGSKSISRALECTSLDAQPAKGATFRSSRMMQLDGIRGIAILLVLTAHLNNFSVPQSGFWLDRCFYFMVKMGSYGVDLFFTLSGFLITGILLDSKGQSRHYFRNFYGRRILRIFPLYYGFLAFMVFVLPVLAKWINHPNANMTFYIRQIQWMFWLFLCNFGEVLGIPINGTSVGVFWSLAVEEQFYLIWPLIVFLTTPCALQRICVVLTVVALLVRIMLTQAGLPWWQFTFARMDALAIGALAAILIRGAEAPLVSTRLLWWISLVTGALAFGIIPCLSLVGSYPLLETVRVSFFSIFFGSVIFLSVRSEPTHWLVRCLANPFLVFFGTYSYGLYVIHSVIRAAMLRSWPPSMWHGSYLPWQMSFLAVALAVCVGVALVSYHLYEKPFLNLKRWLVD